MKVVQLHMPSATSKRNTLEMIAPDWQFFETMLRNDGLFKVTVRTKGDFERPREFLGIGNDWAVDILDEKTDKRPRHRSATKEEMRRLNALTALYAVYPSSSHRRTDAA